MIEAEISCSTCSMKNHCMERSREYPCIDYKPQTKEQERRRNGVRRTEFDTPLEKRRRVHQLEREHEVLTYKSMILVIGILALATAFVIMCRISIM